MSMALVFTAVGVNLTTSYAQAVSSDDADSRTGVVVRATRDKINIDINRVGTSGRALIYAFDADQYPARDTLHGLATGSKGTIVGKYSQGSTQTITIDRYNTKGKDMLFCKYYVMAKDKKTIIAGPFYASDIYSANNTMVTFKAASKKGIASEEDMALDLQLAEDMGTSWTAVNIDAGSIILANEDANGNPIDQSKNDVIKFVSNGKTYYFSRPGVTHIDSLVSRFSRRGINVTAVVIGWANTNYNKYPKALAYTDQARVTMAFNTSNDLGAGYWTAFMEFLAKRYSQSAKQGLIDSFVIGNEIDYAYDWNQIIPNTEYDNHGNLLFARAPFETYMEEYARTLRLANLAVKKYNSNMKVCVSFTKNWATSCYKNYKVDRVSKRYNSYAPKDILDWLIKYERARGDYDWGLCLHPYPLDVAYQKPLVMDLEYLTPVNGDYNTSPWLTVTNLEIIEQYLEKKVNRFGNTIRSVYLTENGFNCVDNTTENMYYQAANMAQFYYRAASLDCVKSICMFSAMDNNTQYNFGVLKTDGTKKLSYDVWKYIDTDKSSQYADKYLKYIEMKKNGTTMCTVANGKIKNWLDVMKVLDTGFNWDKVWDFDAITPRKSETTANKLTLKVEGTEFAAEDPIKVTASGNSTDIVGLYKASEDPLTTDPIYWYYVEGESNGIRHKSGKTYNIKVYGEISPSRYADASLPAGDYKIALVQESSKVIDSKDIKITSSIDLTSPSISTDKDTYDVGEKILVTATGGTRCWAGIYKKGEVPGQITSIYWYYINDEGSGKPSGSTTVLQSTIHNTDSSNPGSVIGAGEYTIYLFDENIGTYGVVASKDITIESNGLQSLRSIKYVIDDPSSGLANGTVTVKKPAGADNITDCIMYWADANGVPLEGYTSLAKFHIDAGETTVFQMYDRTIIPEGAKKLIAYATDGSSLSEDYVSCDLPEGCNYSLDGNVLSEFQMISDIHVTTEAGATNEVRYSNEHFRNMLADVQKNSPNSCGIFINGDMANTGQAAEFKMIYKLYKEANKVQKLPNLHMSIGNHDWIQNNPSNQFQQYVNLFNPDVETDEVYYDEWVNGYHYIYLGGEEPGLRAVLSQKQLDWFDELMAEDTKKDPDRPVFVLLHQPMYNTCAGSLPGQNWDGVATETALRNILQKYGQIIMLGGHSHWELDSEQCMFPGDDTAPITFNTAAVGYLWTSYNIITGEELVGAHGYFVRIYDDKIMFLGRDFVHGKYMPSAMFVVQKNKLDVPVRSYDKTTDSAIFNLNASAAPGESITYVSNDDSVATVDEQGNVTTQGVGTCHITCAVEANSTKGVNREDVVINVTQGDNTWNRWTSDKKTATHSRTKKTDTNVVQTEACKATKGKVLKKATFKKAGKMQFTCTTCGGTYTQGTPAIKSVKAQTVVYNGKKQTPKLTVLDADGNPIASKFYTVPKVKDVGTYKVKVKFKTRYSGTKTIKVNVIPLGTSVVSAESGDKSLTITWKKASSKIVEGYEVSATLTNNPEKGKTAIVKGRKNTSVTLTGLRDSKYYDVKVRTYKTVKGEKVFSDWSEVVFATTREIDE